MNATTTTRRRTNRQPSATAGASSRLRASLRALLTASMLLCPHARGSESMPPGAYEVITETAMPNLEENLRYATTRQQRCWDHQELASAFPILTHQSLTGCRLDEEARQEQAVSYVLICDGGHGTTGTAQWYLGEGYISGTLSVKLGGKNMTFYQRVTAKPLGKCVPEAK